MEDFYWKVVDSLEENKVFKDRVLAFWNAYVTVMVSLLFTDVATGRFLDRVWDRLSQV